MRGMHCRALVLWRFSMKSFPMEKMVNSDEEPDLLELCHPDLFLAQLFKESLVTKNEFTLLAWFLVRPESRQRCFCWSFRSCWKPHEKQLLSFALTDGDGIWCLSVNWALKGTRSNGWKLKPEKFKLEIRYKFLTGTVINLWNSLLGYAMDSPWFDLSKSRMRVLLGILCSSKRS